MRRRFKPIKTILDELRRNKMRYVDDTEKFRENYGIESGRFSTKTPNKSNVSKERDDKCNCDGG